MGLAGAMSNAAAIMCFGVVTWGGGGGTCTVRLAHELDPKIQF